MGGPAALAPSGPLKLTQQATLSPTEMSPTSEEMPSIVSDAPTETPDVIVPTQQSAAPASTGPVASIGGVSSGRPNMSGPGSSFFGQASSAYKIVYVVDVSTSLM